MQNPKARATLVVIATMVCLFTACSDSSDFLDPAFDPGLANSSLE